MRTPRVSESPSGIGRASALLASGTLVSRILGFVSAAVLATAIGLQGSSADTFTLANQLPNNIYAIIAGGLLTAVLVPQIGVHQQDSRPQGTQAAQDPVGLPIVGNGDHMT